MSSKCKTKCDAAKVCNEATGRCVLRTGKIGQQILGTAAAPAAAPKAAKAAVPKVRPPTFEEVRRNWGAVPKVRPLTIEEVRRNWPKGVAKLSKSKYLVNEAKQEWDTKGTYPWWRQGLPKIFGPGAEYLTYERIKELLPNPGDTVRLVVTYEGDGERISLEKILDPAQVWTVTLHRPASAAELWKYRTTDSDSAREIFDVAEKKVVVNGETRFLPDYTTAKMPTEELARRVVIATASPSKMRPYDSKAPEIFNMEYNGHSRLGYWGTIDGRFITWIASRAANNVTVNWSRPGVPMAMKTAIVNASNRGGQKVAANRKAPAGHAQNFKEQIARGIDGKYWKSSRIRVKGRTAYRWVRYADGN